MGNDVVSGILHDTGGISSRFAALALLFLCTISVPAFGSPLFDDDSVLEIRLRGPLGTIGRERKNDDREEYPFVLGVDGREIPVDVKARGKSRAIVCRFPPLRLDFSADATPGTIFDGQDKLKLVTHCVNDKDDYENNVLDEYIAYRIFNLISDLGYRVRLLRIHYDDTDDRFKHLDRPHYGFLIESDHELAARSGGNVAEIEGVLFSRLNDEQTARVFIFQYMIANFDWSLVTAEEEDICCHNLDLIEKDGEMFAIPYDFDRSGLVNARYAKAPPHLRIRRVTERVYVGYCRATLESLLIALDEILALHDGIVSVVRNAPVLGDENTEEQVHFIEEFFDEATNEREELSEIFVEDCIGPR
jgi:hypothetical protein